MPVALYRDHGYLTDMRTGAVGAMVAREIGRTDEVVGIIGAGIQGRCQAQMLAEVIPLKRIFVYDLDAKHAAGYADEMAKLLPGVKVTCCASPVEVARSAKLIVTVTPARKPHFRLADVQPGTHINAVGSDSPGKQELDPDILRAASLYLVDSLAQCERLGELQHALDAKDKAMEIGAFCDHPVTFDRSGITVADMTGLGVEDLYIAQQMFERLGASR
jgi:ornithine cyclodeaminase